MNRSRSLAGLIPILVLAVAGCGTNSGGTPAPAASGAFGPGGSASAGASGSGATTATGTAPGSAGTSAPASATASGGSSASASAGGSASASAGGSGPAVTGNLTVWAMGNEGEHMKSLAKLFMDANPGTTVDVTAIGWDVAHDKLITAIGGNQTPDVSQMGTDMMGEFAKTGALEAVPDTLDKSQFFEGAWNTGVVGGTAYSVPWYVETRVLYYRTDIAQKAGITKAPTTWDELTAAAKAMKEQGGAKWGIGLGPKNNQEYLPFLWQNGGDIASADGTFALNSPQAVEALTFYDSFFESGLADKNPPASFDITPAFVQGTHPMFFSGPWHMGLIKTAGGADIEGKWAVAPMPKKGSGTSWVGGSNLVVYKNGKNKDLAWKFVEFLSKPETQVAWYKEVTDLPAVKSSWDDPALKADTNLAVFGQQLNEVKAPPAISTWPELSSKINDEMEKMTTGNEAPQAAADAMQKAAESLGTGQ